jgi:hypothetical protein
MCIIDPQNPDFDVPSIGPESKDTRRVCHWYTRKAVIGFQSGQDVRYLLNDPYISEGNVKQRLKSAAKKAGVEIYITKHADYLLAKVWS